VPSARRIATRVCVPAACALLLLGTLGGCATTQELAARKQAESKRILERHERRRERRQPKREGRRR
jgi:hypothetical protein